MSTLAQINANRRNSQLSTGPITPEGKAASSHNHLVHGFCAADPVLPTEDRNQFNELLAQYKSDLQPEDTHQEFLVAEMTGARWKLNRLERIETEMFSSLESPEKAFTDTETAKGFARLERYRAALERTYHRCARELRAARKEQFKAKTTQMADNKLAYLLEAQFMAEEEELHQRCAEIRAADRAARQANSQQKTGSE